MPTEKVVLLAAPDDWLARWAGGFLDLLAEGTVTVFPHAPPDPARIKGKAAIMAHQKMLGARVTFDGMDASVVHETRGPGRGGHRTALRGVGW